MARFLVDESSGRIVVLRLRQLGLDVESVNEIMPRVDDDQVIERAWLEQRILVTNDKDFGEKVFRSGLPHVGIVLMRLSDERSSNKARVMVALWEQYGERLFGSFTVVSDRNVRIRKIR